MSHAVIVGGGVSSVLALIQLLKQSASQKITLIHKENSLGRGLAYSTRDIAHLLNVRASRMSLFVDDPENFVSWLKQKGHPYTGDDFVPRALYGQYVHETAQAQIEKHRGHHQVIDLQDEAVDVIEETKDSGRSMRSGVSGGLGDSASSGESGNLEGPGRFFVVTRSGKKIECDRVFIGTGNELPKPLPYSLPGNSKRLINDVWQAQPLPISKSDRVLIVGTGLTMVDLLIETMPKTDQPIVAISRRGLLPQPHCDIHPHSGSTIDLSSFASQPTIRGLLKEARHALKKAQEKTQIPWQLGMDQIRGYIHSLWTQQLNEKEKKRFLRHVVPYWNVFRHRIPTQYHARIQGWIQEGKLKIIPSRILDLKERETEVEVVLHDRRSNKNETWKFDYVLNCTGQGVLPTRINPFLIQLVEKKYIEQDTLGLGIRTDQVGRCLDRHNKPSRRFFALGSLLKGTLWEITAVPDLRVQIEKLLQSGL